MRATDMVTDEQVRRLRKLSNTEKNQEIAASKAGMDPTTARRYLGLERLPSELKKERSWRTPCSGIPKRARAGSQRRCLSGCSGNARGGSATGRSGHYSGGSSYGG